MPACYICDKGMDEVRLDGRDMKPRPCSECEEVINDLILSYKDPVEEDEIDITYLESVLVEYSDEIEAGFSQADLDDTGC